MTASSQDGAGVAGGLEHPHDGFARAGWDIPPPEASMFAWAPIPEPFRPLGSLEFSKDGLVLFGRNFDGATLAAWNVADGRRLGDIAAVDGRHGVLAVSPDGRQIAAAGAG